MKKIREVAEKEVGNEIDKHRLSSKKFKALLMQALWPSLFKGRKGKVDINSISASSLYEWGATDVLSQI